MPALSRVVKRRRCEGFGPHSEFQECNEGLGATVCANVSHESASVFHCCLSLSLTVAFARRRHSAALARYSSIFAAISLTGVLPKPSTPRVMFGSRQRKKLVRRASSLVMRERVLVHLRARVSADETEATSAL
jgi:hypothetical protein